MTNYFEIDFLDVESAKSGDAISIRYRLNGTEYIHVVDGGFQDTGQKVVDHIDKYYDTPRFIDHVVATHPDGDHAGGLRTVLEAYDVGCLWMLRPWEYADELIDRFAKFTSIEGLKKRLREIYPNLAALENIAVERDIPIGEPFQGQSIGAFTVLAPTKGRYLDLVVQSEKTPEAAEERQRALVEALLRGFEKVAAKAVTFLRAAWGVEAFSPDETSAENEMSVIQYANLCGERILLTADGGRRALGEAVDYARRIGLSLPGIDRFQVPHHGSRRNVSTELLDQWLGPRLQQKPADAKSTFRAIISSAKADEHHPRKAVVRALIHRGATVVTTEDGGKRTSFNAPKRAGWSAAVPLEYPEEQEA
jgi:beta-lactamase superfamily II metal-dependent hydrolase